MVESRFVGNTPALSIHLSATVKLSGHGQSFIGRTAEFLQGLGKFR